MSEFSHHWTCPEIDKNLDCIQQNAEDVISDMVNEISPFVDEDGITKIQKRYAPQLTDDVNEYIEAVRDTNVSVREAAEECHGVWCAKVEELQDEIKDNESMILDMECKIEDLEAEIERLK